MRKTAAVLAATTTSWALVGCGGDSANGHASIASVQIASGDTQSGTVGVALSTSLAATVLDSSGHPISGQVVNFVVTQGKTATGGFTCTRL